MLLHTLLKLRALLGLMLLGCVLPGFAYPLLPNGVVVMHEASDHFRLAQGVPFLEDKSGALTLADVRRADQQGRFKPFQRDSLQFGYSSSAYWIKLSLHNQLREHTGAGPTDRFYIAVRYPLLDDVTLYSHTALGDSGQQLGDHHSFYQRLFLLNDLIFPVTLARGETADLYLRVQSTSSLSIPVHLYTERSFVEKQHGITLSDGIYLGVTLGLAIYNLFIFISLRRRSYAVYVIFVLVHMVFTGTMLGYTFALWPKAIAFQQVAVYLLSVASAMSVVWFGMAFLNTAREHPRLHRVLLVYQGIGVLMMGLMPVLEPEVAAKINVLMTLSGVIVIVVAALRSLRKGYRPASYYLVGQGAVLFSVLFTVLTSQNILPYYYLAPQVLKWCSVFELLFFSIGLADLLNEERRMREQAQRATNVAQQELLQVQLRVNAELDQKVRERTDALEQVNEQLQQLTITDELTQLFNRRYFNLAFATEYLRAFREKTPLAVLMIDIDHFKQLNDQFGHLFGDRCLQEAARLIRLNVKRPGDAVARYGGEEFVVLLHDTELEGARKVAQTLLAAFRDSVIVDGSHSVNMTVSIGIAAGVPSSREGHANMLRMADSMLYRAKEGGRNRAEGEQDT